MDDDQSIVDNLFQRAVDHRGSGRLEEAELLCLQVMEQIPSFVPARHLLALIHRDRGEVPSALNLLEEVISRETTRPEYYKDLADTLMSQGKAAEAAQHYRNALGLRPEYFEVHANLGNLLLKMDRVDEALAHYREATRLRPDIAALQDNLGNALRISGDPISALSCHAQALRLDPGLVYAYVNLGVALNELGRYDEAIERLKRALQQAPNIPQAHFSLATALSAQGKLEEALDHYQQTVALDATQPEFHKDLADAYASLGNLGEAIRAYQKSLELNPDYFEVRMSLATVLRDDGQAEAALVHYREAARIRPDTAAEAHCGLGRAKLDEERYETALAHYREAARLRPGFLQAATGEFIALRMLGDMEAARRCIEPYADMRSNNSWIALAFSYLVQNDHDRRVSLDELRGLLVRGVSNKNELRQLYFRLGDLCDALNSYEEAFEYYRQGNELRPQNFQRLRYRRYVDRLLSVFGQEKIDALPAATNDSQLPVFVVGMPRAGKTLIEQVLAGHPQIAGAGELADIEAIAASITQLTGQPFPLGMGQLSIERLNDMAEGYLSKRRVAFPGSTHVVDTMPENVHFLGLIRMLFPRAHIIHCLRNPLDTCLECYFKNLRSSHQYASNLEDLAFRYQQYQRLSQHWRDLPGFPLLEVHYEEMVQNPEDVGHRIIDYLG